MRTKTLSLQEIRTIGFDALLRELGPAGAIRFIQQYEMGQGDYSKDRHQWLDQYSVSDIVSQLKNETGHGDYTRDRRKILPKKTVREIGEEIKIMKRRQSKTKYKDIIAFVELTRA